MAVGDRPGILPEHDHVALVGQRRTGHEMNERFGRGRIEAAKRDDRARRHDQLADAQRP
jgi:hypothetical protein